MYLNFFESLGEKTSLESVILGLVVTLITLVGVIVTMWFRMRKIQQGDKANDIADQTLRVTLSENIPSISLVARIIDKPKLPLEHNASFSIVMTASNAGEKNIVFEQVTAHVESLESGGAFAIDLGSHRMLKEEMPVVEPAESISRKITLVVGETAEPRVKVRLVARVRVGNNLKYNIESDYLTDFIY